MDVPSSTTCCAGCFQPIKEKFILKALDKSWHSKCFCCSVCQIQLTKEYYTKSGRIFCKSHFPEVEKSTKKEKEIVEIKEGCCPACNQPVLPNDLIRRAHGNVYHSKCFACSVCSRKISTGEEFYLKVDKKLLCKADYEALTTKCAGCKQFIPLNHALRRVQGNVYHIECFACAKCKRKFATGEEFFLRKDKKLLCKHDNELEKKAIAETDAILSIGEEAEDEQQTKYDISKPRGSATATNNDAPAYFFGSPIDETKASRRHKASYQFAESSTL